MGGNWHSMPKCKYWAWLCLRTHFFILKKLPWVSINIINKNGRLLTLPILSVIFFLKRGSKHSTVLDYHRLKCAPADTRIIRSLSGTELKVGTRSCEWTCTLGPMCVHRPTPWKRWASNPSMPTMSTTPACQQCLHCPLEALFLIVFILFIHTLTVSSTLNVLIS